MIPERGIIKVGLEIEVPTWRGGRTYQHVCNELIEAGYMLGPIEQWENSHQYGCRCEPGGCRIVRSGQVVVPPLVSLTYDGSLPRQGGEFVTSTILLVEGGAHSLKEIWDIVTKGAIWSNSLPNYHGNGPCSPSIHIHSSARALDYQDAPIPDDDFEVSEYASDVLQALALYAPEILLIADIDAEQRRGLEFRKPSRVADGRNGHHGFVHVRNARPEHMVYVEWRIWEAMFGSWEYVHTAIYFSATLTRALLNPSNISRLISIGYQYPYSDATIAEAIRNDNTDAVLALADPRRLETLSRLCLSELDDDREGYILLDQVFRKAMQRAS